MRGLSLVAVSGGHASSRCAGLSPPRPLSLQSTGSRSAGSVVVAHGPSCSAACGILPDQGSNPCPLHWQADSQPLRHQGSPISPFLDPQCLPGDAPSVPMKQIEQVRGQSDHKHSGSDPWTPCSSKCGPWTSSSRSTQEPVPNLRFPWPLLNQNLHLNKIPGDSCAQASLRSRHLFLPGRARGSFWQRKPAKQMEQITFKKHFQSLSLHRVKIRISLSHCHVYFANFFHNLLECKTYPKHFVTVFFPFFAMFRNEKLMF